MATPLIKLGISKAVIDFFEDAFKVDSYGNIIFDYGEDKFELFGLNKHILPKFSKPWITHKEILHVITDVYLFESALEAICFAHCRYSKIKEQAFDNALFLSLGAMPLPEVMGWVCDALLLKKFHFVFSNSLLGRVMDCRVAVKLANKAVKISHYDEVVFVDYGGSSFQFDEDEFSLDAFKKASGFHFRNGRTHKPPKPFKSFLELIKASSNKD